MTTPHSGAAAPAGWVAREATRLETLGGSPVFAAQLDVVARAKTPPVGAVAVQGGDLRVIGDGIGAILPPRADATPGDRLVLDRAPRRASRVLARPRPVARRARTARRS